MSDDVMLKVIRGMVGLLAVCALAGCAESEVDVRPDHEARPAMPLSTMLLPQQLTLPGNGVRMRWRMPEDTQDLGHEWALTCKIPGRAGAGSARSTPPSGLVEVCDFSQGGDLFYGGVVFQPNVALVEMTFDDRSVIRQPPTGRFFGALVGADAALIKLDLIMPDGTRIPAQP